MKVDICFFIFLRKKNSSKQASMQAYAYEMLYMHI